MIQFNKLGPASTEVADLVGAGWADVIRSGRFVGGDHVDRFEREWADYCETKYAVGVANGTDALHLTLRALEIGPGDEVVVPANTFVATVEAIVLVGATPKFADVHPETLLMTADGVRTAASSATRAVIIVHLYGQPADLDAIAAVTAELGIELIEDAAQAHGARWRSHPAGSVGRAGCFSFYPGKNLGAFGDAGAIVTSDAAMAETLRSMRDHGRSRHHEHERLGTNSRLDSLQAVVLTAKLTRLDAWNERRRVLMSHYRLWLDPTVARPLVERFDAVSVYHLAVVRVPNRDRVRKLLGERGVETGIHYPVPCHQMAPYQRYADGPLPVVEDAAAHILSLPMHPYLMFQDVERVCAELSSVSGAAVAT